MNIVRKHLSAIKGGRLAAAAYPGPARDPGDLRRAGRRPGGDRLRPDRRPTRSTFADARAVLKKYGITEPRAVIEHLDRAADETPKPGDPRLANTSTRHDRQRRSFRSRPRPTWPRQAGVTPLMLGDASRARRARSAGSWRGSPGKRRLRGQPAPPPVVLLSGGETTVTVRGNGRGGRNVEFLLSLAVELGRPAGHRSRWPATPTALTGPRKLPARL